MQRLAGVSTNRSWQNFTFRSRDTVRSLIFAFADQVRHIFDLTLARQDVKQSRSTHFNQFQHYIWKRQSLYHPHPPRLWTSFPHKRGHVEEQYTLAIPEPEDQCKGIETAPRCFQYKVSWCFSHTMQEGKDFDVRERSSRWQQWPGEKLCYYHHQWVFIHCNLGDVLELKGSMW